mmetsp:Transcript_8483/g.17162  ORF Transcript_8483/g.17162 Transcript_8483/m.17162 type:complete len:183 (-) Transcript_8483:932-1480(-)
MSNPSISGCAVRTGPPRSDDASIVVQSIVQHHFSNPYKTRRCGASFHCEGSSSGTKRFSDSNASHALTTDEHPSFSTVSKPGSRAYLPRRLLRYNADSALERTNTHGKLHRLGKSVEGVVDLGRWGGWSSSSSSDLRLCSSSLDSSPFSSSILHLKDSRINFSLTSIPLTSTTSPTSTLSEE